MSQLRDPEIRNRLCELLQDPKTRIWSKRAEEDLSKVPGLTKKGLEECLCNRIVSGVGVEKTENTHPNTGVSETVYVLKKFKIEGNLLYIKLKITRFRSKECIFIFSSHPTK